MRDSDWVLLGAAGVVFLIILGYVKMPRVQAQLPPPVGKPGKPAKPPKLPRTPSRITPVATAVPSTATYLGVCQCVNGILTGPQCKVAGRSCSEMRNRILAESTCACGLDGIATGLHCPFIGQSCLTVGGKLRFPAPPAPSPLAVF